MPVLGVDPGLADTGWAVLDEAPGSGLRLLSSGVLRTLAGRPLAQRLLRLHAGLSAVLKSFRPEAMALEEMFFSQAAHSVRASLQARGVILLAASQAEIPVMEYNPRQVKSALTGSGAAQKPQMQRMVQRTLGLARILRPDDVADAAAIALCHLRLSRFGRVRVLGTIGGGSVRRIPAAGRPERTERANFA